MKSGRYDRSVPTLLNYSIPFVHFRTDHSELNHHYWTSYAESGFVDRIMRDAAKAKSAGTTTHDILRIPADHPDIRRVPCSISNWRRATSARNAWLRQSVLLSAVSYLEHYIRQVVYLSRLSNPLGVPKAYNFQDGLDLMLLGFHRDLKPVVTGITKGEWSQRVAAFEQYFSGAPELLKDSKTISTLQRYQNLRNAIGHAFGSIARLKSEDPTAERSSPEGLTHDGIAPLLKLVFDVAQSIDQWLLVDHIGSFEAIHTWHKSRTNLLKTKTVRIGTGGAEHIAPNDDVVGGAKALLTKIMSETGVQSTRRRLVGAIRYYEKRCHDLRQYMPSVRTDLPDSGKGHLSDGDSSSDNGLPSPPPDGGGASFKQ